MSSPRGAPGGLAAVAPGARSPDRDPRGAQVGGARQAGPGQRHRARAVSRTGRAERMAETLLQSPLPLTAAEPIGEREGDRMQIPPGALVVLVGTQGCGKSTFARRWFAETEIVSSDECRRLVADDAVQPGGEPRGVRGLLHPPARAPYPRPHDGGRCHQPDPVGAPEAAPDRRLPRPPAGGHRLRRAAGNLPGAPGPARAAGAAGRRPAQPRSLSARPSPACRTKATTASTSSTPDAEPVL